MRLVSIVPARIVDVRPPNVTMLVGANATIMCDASGDPSPIVRWLRHDNEIGVDVGGHLEAEAGGLLVINNVTLDYDDWYECEASNGVGPAQRRTVFIDVLGRLRHRLSSSASVTCSRSVNPFTWASVRQLSLSQKTLNPFNASCSKLLLFEGFSAVLV